MKNFFAALIGGVIGIVAGFAAGAFAGTLIASATHMSTFEGAAGYFVVLIGLLGAVVGLFLGVWLAFRMQGKRRSIGAVMVYGVFSLSAIIAVAAGVISFMLFFDETLNRGSSKPQALFEIRLPPGTKLTNDRREVEIELNTDKNSSSAYKSKEEYQHSDGDRPVILGGVELAFRTSSRIVVLKMKGEPDRLFKLNLSGKPGHSDEFGPWQRIDWVAEGSGQPRKATPADQYEIRYRARDPNVEFGRPIIAFELDLPAATPLPEDTKTILVAAIEGQNIMEGTINADAIKRENDRLTIGGTVQLAGDTHSMISIMIPNESSRLFEITLPKYIWITEMIRYATTSPQDESNRAFGPWQGLRFITEKSGMRPAKPVDDAKFRYMLR